MTSTKHTDNWANRQDLDLDSPAWADRQIEPTNTATILGAVPHADNVTASWSPTGMLLGFHALGRWQSLRLDERACQSIRIALGSGA